MPDGVPITDCYQRLDTLRDRLMMCGVLIHGAQPTRADMQKIVSEITWLLKESMLLRDDCKE